MLKNIKIFTNITGGIWSRCRDCMIGRGVYTELSLCGGGVCVAQFLDCRIGAQVTWYGLTGIWVAQLRLLDGRAVIVYGAIGTRLLHSIRPSGKFMETTLDRRTRETLCSKRAKEEPICFLVLLKYAARHQLWKYSFGSQEHLIHSH